MSIFSKTCEYAIRSVIFLASKSKAGEYTSLTDIAHEIGSPEAFTGKILQQLTRSGIIESVKGPHGGFIIQKDKLRLTRLSHIVFAIDGDSVFKGCGLGLKLCSEKTPCPVHDRFKVVREELRKMLEQTSVHDLTSDLVNGMTFLKR